MLLSKNVRVRLIEPVCPPDHVWPLLVNDARLYHVQGTLNTAAFILQAADALALARMIFDEHMSAEATLSRIEEQVLTRLVESLVGTLTPVCGEATHIYARDAAPHLRTFFEVLVEEPHPLRVGVGLARDAIDDAAPLIRPEQLLDVKVSLTAEIAEASIGACEMLYLRPGMIVPLGMPREGLDRLKCGDRVLALGTCGVRGDSRAFAVAKLA